MYGVFINLEDPIDFVKYNYKDLRDLVQILSKKLHVEDDQEEIFSWLILRILEGKIRFDPERKGLQDCYSTPSSFFTTVVLNKIREIKRDRKSPEVQEKIRDAFCGMYEEFERVNRDPLDLNLDLDRFEHLLSIMKWPVKKWSTKKKEQKDNNPFKALQLLRKGETSKSISRDLKITEVALSFTRHYLQHQFHTLERKTNERPGMPFMWINPSRNDRYIGAPRPKRNRAHTKVCLRTAA